MTIFEMLGQSGVLTLLGMAVVFSFLVIMVLCISLAGKVIHALGLDKDVSGQGGGSSASRTDTEVVPAAITAAVTAAVHEYRKNNS